MTADPNEDLIDEPLIAAGRRPFTQAIRIGWTESSTPTSDSFVRYIDPALGEQAFDIAIAQAESVVQPHGVADDFFWKAAGVPAAPARYFSGE